MFENTLFRKYKKDIFIIRTIHIYLKFLIGGFPSFCRGEGGQYFI
jgi:hypothetical protein